MPSPQASGGTPSDPKVAAGWIKTKLADADDLIREAVAELMVERGITAEQAAEQVDMMKHLGLLEVPGRADPVVYGRTRRRAAPPSSDAKEAPMATDPKIEMTQAAPKPGTIETIYHPATEEHERIAVCRYCGAEIEDGWGYWTHRNHTDGSPFCLPRCPEVMDAGPCCLPNRHDGECRIAAA